jgi:hypothetical protein
MQNLNVFIAGEPSGRMIGSTDANSFLALRQPGQLRRVAAASPYRPFWLSLTGQVVEVPSLHMQFVRDNPGLFSLTEQHQQKLAAVPEHYSDPGQFPRDVMERIFRSWIRIQTMRSPSNVAMFTVSDRPGRQHLEAIQDFLLRQRFNNGRVLVYQFPSGKLLYRGAVEDIMTVKSFKRAVGFAAGQVWQRGDGLRYRVVARVPDGWYGWRVLVEKPGVRAGEWHFTDRHLHNLVCSERLSLMGSDVQGIAARMQAAGLRELAACLLVVSRTPRNEKNERLQEAKETEQYVTEKLDQAGPDEAARLMEELENAQDTLEEDGPIVTPPNKVASPNYVTRETIREPNRITRS